MTAFNKRSFLKFLSLTLSSLAVGSLFKRASAKEVQLIYRIDFPTPMKKSDLKDLSKSFFNKSLNREIVKEINCSGQLKFEFAQTENFFQKTITFPSKNQLDQYLAHIKQRKDVINHNVLLDSGYRVYYKVVT
jgi:hypothetical protein